MTDYSPGKRKASTGTSEESEYHNLLKDLPNKLREITYLEDSVLREVFHKAQKQMNMREFMGYIREPKYAGRFTDSLDEDADDELCRLVNDPDFESLDFSEVYLTEVDDPLKQVKKEVSALAERGYHINAYYAAVGFFMYMQNRGEKKPFSGMENTILALALDLMKKNDKPRAVDLCYMIGFGKDEIMACLDTTQSESRFN